ncbi:MAG: (Fe-S)-binding protein [Fimbriimonadaceae bacterium]
MKPLSDLTTQCIRCGFCLESCPTYVITGRETESPRGRIYLIRSADEGVLKWDKQVKQHIDTCLGCRACEPACPSGVQYGQILELARDRLEKGVPHRSKKTLLNGMTSPGKLRWQLQLSRLFPGRKIPWALSKSLSVEAPEVEKPQVQAPPAWPALDNRQSTIESRGEVFLLEGCAMRVLYPRVHEATRRLLRRVGYEIREVEAGCCGALHAHNGYLAEARERALKLIEAMPDDLPIIVNSAGCGATMKDYPGLLEGATGFAARVFDASEFLFQSGLTDLLKESDGLALTVTYHDACHLAHGQGIKSDPRKLIEAIPGVKLIELEESDMCCGSAGIYNLVQPQLARELLNRKWQHIVETRADIVVSGNPGCHAWIEQASREHGGKVQVVHTMELLESAFSGLP